MTFRNPRNGDAVFMGPETSMEVQAALNSDIALVFDECTPFHVDRDYTARSTERTHRWLDRCLRLARRARPGAASSSTGSSRAASTRTCASRRAQAVAAPRRRRDRDRRLARRRQGRRCTRSSAGRPRVLRGGAPAPPARHRRGRRPHPRRRARHRHVRLRHADAPRAATASSLIPDPASASASISPPRASRTRKEPIEDGCPCPACAAGHSRGYLRYLAKNRELTGHAAAHAAQPHVPRAPHARPARRDRRRARSAETAAALRAGAPPSTEPVAPLQRVGCGVVSSDSSVSAIRIVSAMPAAPRLPARRSGWTTERSQMQRPQRLRRVDVPRAALDARARSRRSTSDSGATCANARPSRSRPACADGRSKLWRTMSVSMNEK